MPEPSRTVNIHQIQLPDGTLCNISGNNVINKTFDTLTSDYNVSRQISVSETNYTLSDKAIVCLYCQGTAGILGKSGSTYAKLKVGDSLAKNIYYKGSALTNNLKTPANVIFVYNATDDAWHIVSYDPDGYELESRKLTSNGALNALSTDIQYPSAKLMYEIIGDVETLLQNI